MRRAHPRTAPSLVVATALLLAACGSDSDDPTDTDVPEDVVSGTDDGVPDRPADDAPEADVDGGGLQGRVGTLAGDFLDTVDGLAAAPVPAPEIVFETSASLTFYTRFPDGRAVVTIPDWEELGEERALFESWAGATGGAYDARGLFEELFNWFFVVHELGHHLQDESGRWPRSRWDSELQANEITVAHLGATDRARLDALMTAMRQVRDSLEVPEGAGDRDYFDREYDAILGIPPVYGHFQFGFCLDAYERIDTLELATIVRDELAL